jgi:hypothetical protein
VLCASDREQCQLSTLCRACVAAVVTTDPFALPAAPATHTHHNHLCLQCCLRQQTSTLTCATPPLTTGTPPLLCLRTRWQVGISCDDLCPFTLYILKAIPCVVLLVRGERTKVRGVLPLGALSLCYLSHSACCLRDRWCQENASLSL